MNQKPKRIKAGRPRKDSQKEDTAIIKSSDDENVYIADDSDCEQLFSLFAKQSSYKNITKTGPNKLKKADEEQINLANNEIKKIIDELKQNDESFMEPQFFFLSNEKKKYVFDGDKLLDKTEYMQIEIEKCQYENFKNLAKKLNIVNKELDKNFIQILEEILIFYQSLKVQEIPSDQIVLKLIEHIKNEQNNQKFKYILLWQQLKQATKETRMKRAEDDLKEKGDEIQKKTSEKVKRKHEQFIEQQLLELKEEKDADPLFYLITKLIQIFDKIVGG